jgi:hypothetical protein
MYSWYEYNAKITEREFDRFLNKPNDLASDEYYYSFGEYSGKFVLSDDFDVSGNRMFYSINDPGFKIEPIGYLQPLDFPFTIQNCNNNNNLCNIYYQFQGFKITTPEGIVYEFGNAPNSVEYSLNYYTSEQINDI